MRNQLHIIVRGRVQGVSFRMHTANVARGLGLTGYVRNLANGDVEIVAEGEADHLEALSTWARKGPALAMVRETAVEYRDPVGGYIGFEIRA